MPLRYLPVGACASLPNPSVPAILLRRLLAALGLLVLPLADGRAQERPSPQQLAARHDSLVGGRAALEAHQSLRVVGTLAIPEYGLEAPFEILKKRPDRYLFRATLGAVGEMLSGYDGAHAWSVQPGAGAQLLPEALAASVKRQADFFADLHDLSQFTSLETLEPAPFDGRPAQVLRMVLASGDTLVEYFDASTGLSAGGRLTVATPTGRVESTRLVSEYRTFGGVTVATRIEQRQPQLRMILTIVSVTFDEVTDADVAPPEAVRQLIKP